MQSKFKFSLDGVDATARQFAELRRQLAELQANDSANASMVSGRVSDVENDFKSLTTTVSLAEADESKVVVPTSGGTGVRNAYGNQLSLLPRKTVYCLYDGTLGSDCSSAHSVADAGDGDGVVSVDALRRVKWRVYWFNDDLNQRLDDAQPTVGLLAEDLDEAGLGFFCEYDDDGVPTGVDYPRLSVAALRLAQEAMDEVDELKATVGRLSAKIDKIEETYADKSIDEE